MLFRSENTNYFLTSEFIDQLNIINYDCLDGASIYTNIPELLDYTDLIKTLPTYQSGPRKNKIKNTVITDSMLKDYWKEKIVLI